MGALIALSSPALQAQDAGRPLATLEIPSAAVGGTTLTGTVTLSGAAGALGQHVRITSSSAAAVISTTSLKVTGVTVPFGQTKAKFAITTKGVGARLVVTITAVSGGVTRSSRMIVKPPTVTSIALAAPTVTGSNPLTATVQLDTRAPAASMELQTAGGLVVALMKDGSEASMPATVTVPAGQSSATFQMVAAPVTTPTTIKIAAAAPTQTVAVATTVNVIPPVLKALSISPGNPTGGTSATGTVTLTGKPPAGGRQIALSASLAAIQMATNPGGTGTVKPSPTTVEATLSFPASITIPAGQGSMSFPITTMPVARNTTVVLMANDSGVVQNATFSVMVPVAASLSVQPTRVIGGASATGTVTLNGAAPAQGFNVALASSDSTAAGVPLIVSIAAGQRTAKFPITTAVVDAQSTATITAAQTGPRATLTVMPRAITAISLNTPRVAGDVTVNGTVSISGPAPAGGMSVSIQQKPCSGTILPFIETSDGSVRTISIGERGAMIPEGQSIGAFQITSTRVDETGCFNVTAFQGIRPEDSTDSKTTTLTVLPPLPQSLVMTFPDNANATTGTGRLIGTVEFAGTFVANPITIPVSCSPAGVQPHPITVRVESQPAIGGGGTAHGAFETRAIEVANDTLVTCSVTRGGTTKRAAFTVLGPRINVIELAGSRVVGGNPITGTVTLTRRAPSTGITITVDGNNDSIATVSNRISIPSGQTIGAFQITTTPVTTPSEITLTATLNGERKTATFTVTP